MRPQSPRTPQVRPAIALTACPASACPLFLLSFPAFASYRTLLCHCHVAPAMQAVTPSGLLGHFVSCLSWMRLSARFCGAALMQGFWRRLPAASGVLPLLQDLPRFSGRRTQPHREEAPL